MMLRKCCFSLVELLVVTAILAILLLLSILALNRIREQVRRTSCLNILRVYGSAVHAYGGDHDDFFPTNSLQNPSLRAEFRSFWKLMANYAPASGRQLADNGETFPAPTPLAETVPYSMICPSALLSFEQNRSRIFPGDLYEARPTRLGAYETALINFDAHPASGGMPGKRRISSLPSPSLFFFINDTGFNDQTLDPEFPYWFLRDFLTGRHFWGHGCFYHLGFIDGHASGFRRKRRDIRWESVYTRVLENL